MRSISVLWFRVDVILACLLIAFEMFTFVSFRQVTCVNGEYDGVVVDSMYMYLSCTRGYIYV